MIRYTFKSIGPIALYLSIVMLFYCCDNKNDVEFYNCVGDLPIDEFYFMGTHDDFHVEYYDQFYISFWGETNFASITFKEDSTFRINIEFICDSLTSMLPICDSLEFASGHSEELIWEGIWESFQSLTTFSYDCGWWSSSSKTCKQTRIRGTCYLNIQNSPNGTFDNERIACEIYVDCAGKNSLFYGMDIELPLENEDKLHFQISFDEYRN